MVYLVLSFRSAPAWHEHFQRLDKIYFLIEIQIIRDFDYIYGIQSTPKQNNNNEHSRYMEIYIYSFYHFKVYLDCYSACVPLAA